MDDESPSTSSALIPFPTSPSALVAATTADDGTYLVGMGIHHGTTGDFEIFGVPPDAGTDAEPGPLVATETFTLWVARLPDGQIGLMKTNAVKGIEGAAVLQREAEILDLLQKMAADLDESCDRTGHQRYYYGALFPRLIEVLAPTPNQTVTFLGYDSLVVTSYSQFIPVSALTRDARVDLQTVVWMLGKYLKLLAFVHGHQFTIGRIDPSNQLVETDVHGVFALDFSDAIDHPTDEQCTAEVGAAARIAWNAAGGSDTQDPPYDPDIMSKEQYDEFVELLRRMMEHPDLATDEHQRLYTLADAIWPREPWKTPAGEDTTKRAFHPFVTYPR